MDYKIGFVGLGRMGGNMVLNLLDKKHTVVGYDKNPDAVRKLKRYGMIGASSLEELTEKLDRPRVNWLMIPSKTVGNVLDELVPLLEREDVVIDGGNSASDESIKRYHQLKEKGVYLLDCGTSGGLKGARYGGSMSIGGDKKIFRRVKQLFEDLSISYGHFGNNGKGHLSKAYHNAIEYIMMAAIAEIIEAAEKDGIDPKEFLRVFSRGSIIEGKPIDYALAAMRRKDFESISGSVPKGETEEEMEKLVKKHNLLMLREAIDLRINSRLKPSRKGQIIAGMRKVFGGHSTNKVA